MITATACKVQFRNQNIQNSNEYSEEIISDIIANTTPLSLDDCTFVAQGGEGYVYHYQGQLAFKIFMKPEDKHSKIKDMISHPAFKANPYLVQPLKLITNHKGKFIGYVMKFHPNQSYYLINEINRTINTIKVLEVYRKFHTIITKLHSEGVIIGDFNPDNFLWMNGFPLCIDTDAWGFDSYPADSKFQQFKDPCMVGPITQDNDRFALASMLYYSLIGLNPYKTKSRTNKNLDPNSLDSSLRNNATYAEKFRTRIAALPQDLYDFFETHFHSTSRPQITDKLFYSAEQYLRGYAKPHSSPSQQCVSQKADVVEEQFVRISHIPDMWEPNHSHSSVKYIPGSFVVDEFKKWRKSVRFPNLKPTVKHSERTKYGLLNLFSKYNLEGCPIYAYNTSAEQVLYIWFPIKYTSGEGYNIKLIYLSDSMGTVEQDIYSSPIPIEFLGTMCSVVFDDHQMWFIDDEELTFISMPYDSEPFCAQSIKLSQIQEDRKTHKRNMFCMKKKYPRLETKNISTFYNDGTYKISFFNENSPHFEYNYNSVTFYFDEFDKSIEVKCTE